MSGDRRARPERGLRARLAAIVLATEAVVVLLASLVVFGLRQLPPGLALGGGGALLLAALVAASLAGRGVGIALGWLVQVVLVASVVVDVAVGVVGIAFAALWVYCMIVSGRIDRRRAA